MSKSTLEQIKKKARRLTASSSTRQLSEADLEEYIDTFYEQDMPSSLKLWNLKNTYTFYTEKNEDRYVFDKNTYHTVAPPVFVDGYQTYFTSSREEFNRLYNFVGQKKDGPSGNGTAGPYTMTLTNLTVLKREVVISVINTNGETEIVTDSPVANSDSGNLIDQSDGTTVRGTVNYVTGAVSVTWGNTIDTTETIKSSHVGYTAGRPSGILFYYDYFLVRPVPDRAYKITLEATMKPTQLMSANNHSDSNTPDIAQWWQYIAFGAAKKILEDRQDMEGLSSVMVGLKEQEELIINRMATQFSSQRAPTIYSEQAGVPSGAYMNGAW